jgi:Sigma-70, region 4/Anti-sigma-K factor rskA
MATFDQLSDEQRAIVELVLQQGKSYEELSEMLGMPESRVRELARDALVELAPVSASAVEEDWRGQLADYVLGQQAGPEATATRGHMRRSEAARSWTRSLLDSLEQLYPNGDLPAIPEGDRGRDRGTRRTAATAAPTGRGPLGPKAASAARRPQILAAAAAALVVILVAILLWPIGVLTGDDDNGGGASGSNGQAASSGGSVSAKTQGSAIIATRGGKPQLVITAQGLQPTAQGTGYQVWLYNSQKDRKSLGAAATDQQGNLQAGAQLPADYRRYRFIDLSSVTVRGQGRNQTVENGPSVLRGLLQLLDRPVSQGTGKNRVTVLAQIALKPLPQSGG